MTQMTQNLKILEWLGPAWQWEPPGRRSMRAWEPHRPKTTQEFLVAFKDKVPIPVEEPGIPLVAASGPHVFPKMVIARLRGSQNF